MESLSHLTDTDRTILMRSWRIVSRDMETLAVDIFQMIFEQSPDAKLMFTFMQKDYRDDEKKSTEFSFHALRFIQVIESTMNHLDDPAELDPLFLNLGKIHAKHEEQLGFSTHYWSVFKECVLFHFRKAMKHERKCAKKNLMSMDEIDCAIILWREVLRFIINRMKVGLESNGIIRKANRQEVLNGQSMDKNGTNHLDAKQGVTQLGNFSDVRRESNTRETGLTRRISQALRRTELSVIVPEYFLRRRSEEHIGDSSPN